MLINGQEYNNIAVLGLGLTGCSCARFLAKHTVDITLYDTRTELDLTKVKEIAPNAPVTLGALSGDMLSEHQILLVSPGIAIDSPAIEQAKQAGTLIWGDVELFAHFVNKPVVGITGSNGKTTVTTLLTQMGNDAGVKTLAIGNIGVPVLDGLADSSVELFIMELSSFQLETTHSLALNAATVLNVTDDHMDRYHDLAHYANTKRRIYNHSSAQLINRQDLLTQAATNDVISFGSDKPTTDKQYGIFGDGLYRGEQRIMSTRDIAMVGQHNYLNALSALALGEKVGLPIASMVETLHQFSGLAHRCARVASADGICWLNDSKATNVGATLAALTGLKKIAGQLIVIAGGDAKGGDLTPLAQPFAAQVDCLIVIGKDKQLFHKIYPSAYFASSMSEAVAMAANHAKSGDTVLLSPSCASIDMFENYMARGQAFIDAVGGNYDE